MSGRVDRAVELIEERSLDALVVTNLVNVRYLSGFTGSNAALVISPDQREDWRRESVIADLCVGTVSGKGVDGYRDALALLKEQLA